jgi:hypothetical protein
MVFEVVIIDKWLNKSVEYIGSKAKAWYINPNADPGLEDQPYLFKEPKSGTGEDWSELVAFHIAKLLGLPCAEYQLATLNGRRGVISLSFVPKTGELIVGTELVVNKVPGYTDLGFFRRSPHTLDLVWDIIESSNAKPPIGINLPEKVISATDVFTGYLMLDALVGNGDRHDENWALVRLQAEYMHCPPGLYLAPTYDHAACLGRELPDEQKEERLATRDANKDVAAYLARNRSAFFAADADKKPIPTLDVFRMAKDRAAAGAEAWLCQLASMKDDKVATILNQIPPTLISDSSRRFARNMLSEGKKRLLALR